MRTVPLDEAVSGTVGANGTCTLTIGPRPNQEWEIESEAVKNTSTVLAPTAFLYSGPSAVDSQLLANTYDGINDTAGKVVRLKPGGTITAKWFGADVGSRCTLSVYGTMKVR
jgi:hypothetical protein